jgi:hypothetical protein
MNKRTVLPWIKMAGFPGGLIRKGETVNSNDY